MHNYFLAVILFSFITFNTNAIDISDKSETYYGMGYEERMATLNNNKKLLLPVKGKDNLIRIQKNERLERPERPYRPMRPMRPGR